MIRIIEEAEEELTNAALWYEKERAGLGEELLAEADRALTAILASSNQTLKMQNAEITFP